MENSDEHIRISLQNAVYHEVPIDLFFSEISKKDFQRVFPTGTHLNSRAIVFTFYIDSSLFEYENFRFEKWTKIVRELVKCKSEELVV